MGLRRDQAYQRGVELGPYPLEALARGIEYAPTARIRAAAEPLAPNHAPLATAARHYAGLFAACITQPEAPLGEGSTDSLRRAREIKGAAHYLDAAHVGICQIPAFAWFDMPSQAPNTPVAQRLAYAVVLLTEFGPPIEPGNPAHDWIKDSQRDIARMRAMEIGASLTGHLRALGFAAQLHYPGASQVCLQTLGVNAGVVHPDPTGTQVISPFLGRRFAMVCIATNYAMAIDLPLRPNARVSSLSNWLGINGAVSGRERRRQARRPSHLSRYPMEQVTRVERPTTLILDDEVPRVPKRAEFFMRARSGDLGDKAQREVTRFAFKHPLTDGMMYPLRAMVPHQDGQAHTVANAAMADPVANSLAIKSLSYHLGADLTGICEIPDYAWYSHGPDGQAIEIKHRYAIVMLIDQGYDTMEGASGDDWISGCQSMRGYIRGAEIAGVMAHWLRSQGIEARPQTNADSQVLQIPLVLLAGLGELSRIGELVLNPFVGPRFKSVVVTTNLPLIADAPIDFGLQKFCSNCMKCARECPVNAIPFGDKVMFNGYEIWKPDVERCTRYRVTNPKGSACGRCMKTCPLNKVVHSDGAWLHRLGSWLGVNAGWLKPLLVPVAVALDDRLGYGTRNPVKRWWQDLEMIDGRARFPRATNERDLDIDADVSGTKSPVGYYHAADNPPADANEPVMADHKAAIARASQLETVAQARARKARGAAKPAHYIAVKTLN